ncbi:FecCD family ABC transporter permease [Falsirhodobacter sp. 20TX0035]|uniref:FecCD family ABC transporter permease n=1 Tax=Falsirhodobacter sp. 20TX0035 TaxID=3022019 RepID=UPI00232C8558|nr:iron ABC transporter permease [Falsirhodobacter sp. 20TX0035]MDB6452912.1 iron ABC transporter permease [Falsirhodobacter sp. 20TX0035]
MTARVDPVAAWRRRSARRALVLAAALAALVALMLADLATGPSGMPLHEVLHALGAGPGGADRAAATILFQIRLPQALMGVIVGACLGLAGLLMQTMLANPLASPYTLGFSAAAGFGASLSILGAGGAAFGLPLWLLTPLSAFLATLAATGLVATLAHLKGHRPEIMVLSGIAVLFLFQSLQSLVQFLSSPEVLQQIVFWLFGSLLKANWTSVGVSGAILLACLPWITRDVWALTALRMGEANAETLGLNLTALRRRTFLLTAALTAAAVSFTGTIGFVGLIAPHIARAMVGEDHRFALPAAALTGALILMAASVLGKLISPGAALPVGIVTALAGVPMLIVVLWRYEES